MGLIDFTFGLFELLMRQPFLYNSFDMDRCLKDIEIICGRFPMSATRKRIIRFFGGLPGIEWQEISTIIIQ